MIPTSEQLELFLEQLKDVDRELAKLNGAEVRKAETIATIKATAKCWFGFSEGLHAAEIVPQESLGVFDSVFQQILDRTNARTRSSAYRSKMSPLLSSFMQKVVIPVIRHEGSPTQVASRRLLEEFAGRASSDEQSYLEEAATCLATRCNRAAIVLLWAAAISRIHSAIEKVGFNAYNAALDRTTQKRGNPFSRVSKAGVSSLPELQRARDFDLLVVGMELWNYDLQVFEELDRLLGIRNGAAHPGMLQPTALDVQQYASKIAGNIFARVLP